VKGWKQNEGWAIGCFIIASGLILFYNLWARTLENHDYLRYAEVAREMIRSGDWVVSRLNGKIYLDKPPLLFWLIAIPSSIDGSVTPLIARLPSAFSAWIGVIVLFLWGKRIYGSNPSGLIAGGILLSSYQFFYQARLAKTDMVLCLLILFSLYFFYLGYWEPRKRRYLFHSLSFFFMGLGTLAKGPFGCVIPFLIILIYLTKEGRWRRLISKEFILGYVILMLTVLPWIFLFFYRVGVKESIALAMGTQILTRKAPIYFYFIQIWPQFFPWSLLLPFLFLYIWRQKGKFWHSEESLFLIWFMVLFVLLTLFTYRASRYLLPALPPLVLMIAGMWRKKFLSFLIPFLGAILIWHSVEFYWISKNLSHSPGMVLAGELRPFFKESTLIGYRVDRGTVEEINFYLDPVVPIPLIKRSENLSDQLMEKERVSVLMPKEVYEKVKIQGNLSMHLIQEFRHKKGQLVLVSH
jgi:4-amino-4-deoxy-L-arabinose transferase-like glycosyltransferase